MNKRLKGFDKLDTMVQDAIEEATLKSVVRVMQKLERRAVNFQRGFFKYVVFSSGVFGSSTSNAPVFEGISQAQPKFAELTDEYQKRKIKKFNGTLGQNDQFFFLYKTELAQQLSKLSSIKTFGNPIVYYARLGQKGNFKIYQKLHKQDMKEAGVFTKSGNRSTAQFKVKKGAFGTIFVDLFPKVTDLKKPLNMKEFFTKEIGVKLMNYKTPRPFLTQAMEHWVKVKGRRLFKEL